MGRSGTRVVTAIGLAALLATSACSALLGLDPKEEEEGSDDGGGTSPSPDAADGDPSSYDATGAGDGGGGPSDGGAAKDGGGGDDATVRDASKGDSAAADTAPSPDSGCAAMGPVPDGSPRTFYGSCAKGVICNAYGYTGNLGVTPATVQIQKGACANLSGTWKDAPCDTGAAVFGCQTEGDTGYVCESLGVTWYYPPATVADEGTSCPASVGTIILP